MRLSDVSVERLTGTAHPDLWLSHIYENCVAGDFWLAKSSPEHEVERDGTERPITIECWKTDNSGAFCGNAMGRLVEQGSDSTESEPFEYIVAHSSVEDATPTRVESQWHSPSDDPPESWWGPVYFTKTDLYRAIWKRDVRNPTREIDRRLKADQTLWGLSMSKKTHEIYYEKEGRYLRAAGKA